VAFIAAGSSAAHCIVGDVNGVCYTWGRNEVRCQLLHSSARGNVVGLSHQPEQQLQPQFQCMTASRLFCDSHGYTQQQ
jgi:hypothetical protein